MPYVIVFLLFFGGIGVTLYFNITMSSKLSKKIDKPVYPTNYWFVSSTNERNLKVLRHYYVQDDNSLTPEQIASRTRFFDLFKPIMEMQGYDVTELYPKK